MIGTVALVGAGPGDPELITLRAVRVLATADVILHDALVTPATLAHARPDARRVDVGKRGGAPSTSQAFIVRLMIHEARAGRRVVRLKGGDPFVFGRGGEEVEALQRAGIPVEVVPGLTSGLAGPAVAGIAVTHRAHAHGVALVTAQHASADTRQAWAALAASGLTLVIYMGMQDVARVQRQLLDAGYGLDLAAAFVTDATRPTQRVVRTRVADLAATASAHDLASPAIIVVGEVARSAEDTSAALATCAIAR